MVFYVQATFSDLFDANEASLGRRGLADHLAWLNRTYAEGLASLNATEDGSPGLVVRLLKALAEVTLADSPPGIPMGSFLMAAAADAEPALFSR